MRTGFVAIRNICGAQTLARAMHRRRMNPDLQGRAVFVELLPPPVSDAPANAPGPDAHLATIGTEHGDVPLNASGMRSAKRVLDVVVAAALLALTLPLLLLLAVAIRLETRGPALFRQTRLGLHGKPFAILKLRTMRCAEDGMDVVQACRNDPRVTRLGRLLRTASLDELPQLFNVLKGEMSLVGPRPHAVAHDRHYARLIPHYARRQTVKPGLTGLAQIRGHRGETATLQAMAARIACDLHYVRNASFVLDLRILLVTPLALLRARNAF